MNHRWRASALTLLVALGLSLAGCSQSPLALDDSVLNGGTGGFTSPPIAAFAADGSLSCVQAPIGATPDAPVMKASTAPSRAVSSSAYIEGSRGGTLKAGRFSVKLPPGAFTGPAIVMLSMADSTVMICDLSISPSSQNSFKVPAELTADLSSVDASTFTTYWYDPAKRVWVSLQAKSIAYGSFVTTSLDHFSTYAEGKAGW